MITPEDIAILEKLFATKYELKAMEDRVVKAVTKIVNDARDYMITELRPVKEDFGYNRVEHDDFNKRLDKIESTPS